ncbi:hypothetical protein GF312_07925 [Candidatus Poribacteria bacterium]|nr:hypothetical protein [Candidatus Poribacteria bacterium]
MLNWKAKKSLIFSISMIGFTATSSQIVVIREFMVVFYGNELCLGLILANWLLWGAVGSWILGRISDRIKWRIGILVGCQIFMAFLLPAIIYTARISRLILKVQPGEVIGILPISIFTFVILSPLCAILGFLFALAARIYPTVKDAKRIGHIYILEAVGASVGGLLTSVIMIRYLNSFYIVMIISALNLAAVLSLETFVGKPKSVKFFFKAIIACLLLINIYLVIPSHTENQPKGINHFKADSLHMSSLIRQWGMLGLKESRNSIYSNLTVVGRESNRSFYSNGLNMFTVPDPASAEQVAHFPMLEHPEPRKVLLIGGGVGGSLDEILKHPVKQIDYLEIDPVVIELARKWLDEKYLKPLENSRVRVKNMDGRRFVKNTKDKYDVIILDLPEPFTAQLNRFYTLEFFQEIKHILNTGGVFSLGLVSSANYISDEHQKFLNCIYKTMEIVFEDIIIIPADDRVFFIANTKKDVLTYDRQVLNERLRNRKVESLYVSEYQMPVWLDPFRVEGFSQRIQEPQDTSINRDFRPVSYYYDMILWSSHFASESKLEAGFKLLFEFISGLNFWWFLLPVVVIGIIIFSIGNFKRNVRNNYIIIAVAVTGFAEITFEVVVSLAFQIIYGYMYYKLGMILTAFMMGLILGSIVITRIMDKIENDLKVFTLTQVAVCIYPLILLANFWFFRNGSFHFLGANIVFPILPVIAGFIGGFQFPLATKIYLKYKTRAGQVAGLTYGMDLLGSCVGAFLVSAFLVPLIGITGTCFVIVILSFIVLILILQNFIGIDIGI